MQKQTKFTKKVYPVDRVLVGYLEGLHGPNKGIHGEIDVLVDQFYQTASLLI